MTSSSSAVIWFPYIGFAFSCLTNTVLIYLIVHKSSKKLGNYKNLMLCVAVFGLFYSITDLLVQPTVHIYGTTFLIICGSWFKYDRELGIFFISLYCACFGLFLILLAFMFFYRYIAVCRNSWAYVFEGRHKYLVIGFFFILGILWHVDVNLLMRPTPEIMVYIKDVVKKTYDEDVYKVAFTGPFYYYTDSSGSLVIMWRYCIGMAWFTLTMVVTFMLMIYLGSKTYLSIKSESMEFSARTRDLHKQLFNALLIQTLIPVMLLYIPVSWLFIMPMFQVNVGTMANQVPMYLALYPPLDSLAVILLIRDFRHAFLCFPPTTNSPQRLFRPTSHCGEAIACAPAGIHHHPNAYAPPTLAVFAAPLTS